MLLKEKFKAAFKSIIPSWKQFFRFAHLFFVVVMVSLAVMLALEGWVAFQATDWPAADFLERLGVSFRVGAGILVGSWAVKSYLGRHHKRDRVQERVYVCRYKDPEDS